SEPSSPRSYLECSAMARPGRYGKDRVPSPSLARFGRRRLARGRFLFRPLDDLGDRPMKHADGLAHALRAIAEDLFALARAQIEREALCDVRVEPFAAEREHLAERRPSIVRRRQDRERERRRGADLDVAELVNLQK